jgi:limonene-1,2-epoxide hydrolase
MSAPHTDDRAARVIEFFERLQPQDVRRLGEIYARNAYFRDPFNEVRGVTEIERIFDDMFLRLADCRFAIQDAVADESALMLTWDFTFRIRRYKPQTEQKIHGASHLKFDASGRIAYHRDYWDAADELYAKLPLIGPVMRMLKRRLA